MKKIFFKILRTHTTTSASMSRSTDVFALKNGKDARKDNTFTADSNVIWQEQTSSRVLVFHSKEQVSLDMKWPWDDQRLIFPLLFHFVKGGGALSISQFLGAPTLWWIRRRSNKDTRIWVNSTWHRVDEQPNLQQGKLQLNFFIIFYCNIFTFYYKRMELTLVTKLASTHENHGRWVDNFNYFKFKSCKK